MKKVFLTIIIILATVTLKAQNVAISNSSTPPDPSAMLDIMATDKGMLIPRMNSFRRNNNVTNPAEGLIVFDTDTKTFWYYQAGWKEIPNNTIGANPTGTALGDLYGNYPSPAVGKIQNLDVAFGVPFDRQVFKWDMLNNRWQGMNDSLFLPYNVTFGSPAKLFAITNANISEGSCAIFGKSSNAGSGITTTTTVGVWGDNSTGTGIFGTSNTGKGVHGFSINNHGVHGFSLQDNFAGVYATRGAGFGPAVLGEVNFDGMGIYGKSTGTQGKAAWFENIHTANADTVVKFIHRGLGVNSYLINDNINSTGSLIKGEHMGKGPGIQMSLFNSQNNSDGISLYQAGNGRGLYISSDKSKAAEFYTNALNTDTTVYIRQDGFGKGLQINVTKTSNINEAVYANIKGVGTTAVFEIDNTANLSAAVKINTNGTGRGLQANITNAASTQAAVYGNSLGSIGVEGVSVTTGILGRSATNSGGVGVLGQSSINSTTGIGVKGVSYSTNQTSGAVTGINNLNGIGVYGETITGGIGVYGKTESFQTGAVTGYNYGDNGWGLHGDARGVDGVAVYGEAGISGSLSKAAVFRNMNAVNTRSTVDIFNGGLGNGLYINNPNPNGTLPSLRIKNQGDGKFLSFEDGSSVEKFNVEKTGDITTSGTLTVNGDKGIVRNSASTQMRMQELTVSVPASSLSSFQEFNSIFSVNVSFPTAFSAVPSVYLGNIITGGVISSLHVYIDGVTSTGFTLKVRNLTNRDLSWGTSSFKVMAIGAE
jgi:hypothetical protein